MLYNGGWKKIRVVQKNFFIADEKLYIQSLISLLTIEGLVCKQKAMSLFAKAFIL